MTTALVWFRKDLRLTDNPCLVAACEQYDHVLPVYIWDADGYGGWQPGEAAKWWLHMSLESLSNDLSKHRSGLVVRQGDSLAQLRELVSEHNCDAVFWNRVYEPALIERDRSIKSELKDLGLQVQSFNGSLMVEPWELTTQADDHPYKVFTPYFKKWWERIQGQDGLSCPTIKRPPKNAVKSLPLSELGLLPTLDWADSWPELWQPGESGANEALRTFSRNSLTEYDQGRDLPAEAGTSQLSPHLHFGEVSARQVYAWLRDNSSHQAEDFKPFVRELAWREFSYQLLYNFPATTTQPLKEKFAAFEWRDSKNDLEAWQNGLTGVPMVDAGMRQLWQIGWMHNRVRMIVASFLTKNLRIHWLSGAKWFWDTLVDADLANNTQGWQWTAGSGADAQPFFRIFNPVSQGKKYDPDGEYVKRWVPELAGVPKKHIHAPWEMSSDQCAEYNFELGKDYPRPIVDLKESRQAALEAYQRIK